MAVRAILVRFADGAWHDVASQALTRKAILLSLKVGMAIRRGWMEQRDDTWVRLTPLGRSEVESMYGRDPAARAYRVRAEELRAAAEDLATECARRNFLSMADNCDQLAKHRELEVEQSGRAAG